MNSQGCLIESGNILVADASVVINLLETRCINTILNALPNQMVISSQVDREILHVKYRRRGNTNDLREQIAAKKITVVELEDLGAQHFEYLVCGPAQDTLDDGEAATIAIALELNATPLIDEPKATRICEVKFPELVVGCSVDIFAHDKLEYYLGRDKLVDAVFNALRDGRMRVPPQFMQWVVNLIGQERANECSSLPKSVRMRK